MPIHNPLEYAEEGEEDGLFTDEEDVSNAIAASMASAKAEGHQEAGPSTPPSRAKVTLPKVHKVGIGAKTLRDYCSKIIMRYHLSITDVGEEIMYEQLQFMLDICERPQLEEIETNSPQLKPDTDHLWQAFMRKEYGKRYTEILQTRKGKPVKSWRKQFRLEKERQEERAREASSRLKENYARLQEEKKAKKMVVISANLEPPPKKRKTSSGWSAPTPTSKLDRIRKDTSAARRSLTHASGLARPSPQPLRSGGIPSNPWVARSHAPTTHSPITHAPPRSPATPSSYKYETPGMSVTSGQTYDPFRGTAPRNTPAPKPPPSTLRPIVKPAVKNFQPVRPHAPDFFSSAPGPKIKPPPKR